MRDRGGGPSQSAKRTLFSSMPPWRDGSVDVNVLLAMSYIGGFEPADTKVTMQRKCVPYIEAYKTSDDTDSGRLPA